ncbi:hypothetical protein [Mycolicibacterium sp.]|uniref:hypothetical protein n=1 Tax=Mycolicibacterium sp. TaxID=2320850 RepID=UPI003D0D0790
MTRRAAMQLLVALIAVVGCVASWREAISVVIVDPVLEGEPATTSLTYSPPLLVLSMVLATVAGVFVVLAVARIRRARMSAAAAHSA